MAQQSAPQARRKKRPPASAPSLPAPTIEVPLVAPQGRKPTTQLVMPEGESATLVEIRYWAGVFYTTDVRQRSVRDMLEVPKFAHLNLKTLEYWCVKDEWVRRRQDFLDKMRQSIEHRIGTEIVRKRLQELEKMETLIESLYGKLSTGFWEVKSLESAVTALVRLMARADTVREKLIQDLPMTIMEGASNGSPVVRPVLSPEEMRAMASMLMRQRREQTRAERAAMDAAKEEHGAPEVPESSPAERG